MKLVLTILALCFATSALAADVTFKVSGFRSERKNGNNFLTINLKEDGTARVTLDPNHCDETGRVCTLIAVRTWEAPIKVVSDRRPVDGPLTLQVGERLQLSVGSGFNREGKVTYTAILSPERGDVELPPVSIPLFADVDTRVQR